MRDDYPRTTTSVLVWLMAAIIAGFVLQNVFLRWFGLGHLFDRLFALSPDALASGQVWTLLTYSFLHSPSNLLHIVGNLLGLYFLGRELETLMGSRRLLGFFAAAALAGGLLWTAVNWNTGGYVIGASAAVTGLLVIFACFYPNRPITFLLFFILPVTLKPKYVALGLLALDLCGFIFYEIMGALSPFGFAHSAHLGGMMAGWIYFRYIHEGNWRLPTKSVGIELPRWAQRKAKTGHPAPTYQVNVSSRSDLKAEVDRILDKINSHGFGALTPEEKRLLDEARDLLSRR